MPLINLPLGNDTLVPMYVWSMFQECTMSYYSGGYDIVVYECSIILHNNVRNRVGRKGPYEMVQSCIIYCIRISTLRTGHIRQQQPYWSMY